MRTIKFRGKDNHNEWVYGSLIQFNNEQPIIEFVKRTHPIDSRVLATDWVYVQEETVGQFTGLIDKNNNEIYDGDIVKDSEGRISYVKWLAQRCGFVLVYDRFDINLTGYDKIDYIEVIGNIHDNPELIKGE